ncbi:Diaminopimelate epimerase [Caulifigura coniformis]|uniref:Diaminopimelate epimerase n=1 Tax=Caulifigura coniformis TaxID=2527983 RepID=A0A517SAN8_9PLAN|nr:diaminopimelate epimerase [Caulifigura coniformis]QDT53197.1 Diaminopimelate epimerase [Caulifigura coniformis]
MKFTKMHGAGNDYVYVNAFTEKLPSDLGELARKMADRHFGIGGDGMILICPSERADARMRMFNLDGSEGEMCGNGVRCVGKYVYDHGIATKETVTIETGRGVLTLQLFPENGKVARVRVNMGKPIFNPIEIPTTLTGEPPKRQPVQVAGRTVEVTAISMGNPHGVVFVDEPTDEWVLSIGPKLETHPVFPRRANIEFVKVLSRTEFQMRVWERGSGETWACGTGACASAVAGMINGLFDRKVLAHLRGGDLEIEWADSGEVFMTGPAAEVFSGEWPE